MEANPHRVSRRSHGGTHCRNDAVYEENPRRRHYNHHHSHGDEETKCSGKRCRSWAAAAIADCVALCCCPCAIINLLTLTFVKVPWMIGRRCLGGGRKNRKKRMNLLNRRQRRGNINGGGDHEFHHNNNNKHHLRFETTEGEEKCGCGGGGGCYGGGDYDDHRFVVERDGSLTKEKREEDGDKTASFKGGDHVHDDESRISARVEAERVWLELYQIGHLGFGRVSFTGIQ
ncbi:hypothetical protein CARUB_v10003445mg [Capsella rubella]|uniref:Uncharacterized protein n=1 Tax=Capsella rubella TaxID=81985 RepID=R0H7Y3_9BRAS|nr:uncharacterized protein LOC17884661 [Capsella rubella]EOA19688.1 hypothetical protein CARUB_v10003445mg [Capsella rubella]